MTSNNERKRSKGTAKSMAVMGADVCNHKEQKRSLGTERVTYHCDPPERSTRLGDRALETGCDERV